MILYGDEDVYDYVKDVGQCVKWGIIDGMTLYKCVVDSMYVVGEFYDWMEMNERFFGHVGSRVYVVKGYDGYYTYIEGHYPEKLIEDQVIPKRFIIRTDGVVVIKLEDVTMWDQVYPYLYEVGILNFGVGLVQIAREVYK